MKMKGEEKCKSDSDSLFEHHFRGALRKDGNSTLGRIEGADDSAHRFSLRVEGEDLEHSVLGVLVPDVLVRTAQGLHETQEGAFRLVSKLGRQVVGPFWWLDGGRGAEKMGKDTLTQLQIPLVTSMVKHGEMSGRLPLEPYLPFTIVLDLLTQLIDIWKKGAL